ncbi:MAG TPA: ferrous iron transport protein B [Deltaproteobacteria bacterium]|nr:ferrous iron transport protein B [Deltaproteobacteria bacterium]
MKKSSNPSSAKKILVVGLPNTGKSQIFNNLTGEYAVVANSPLTTIEIKRAHCRIEGQLFDVVDTPGLHSLYIHSEEELVVRDAIFSERPDVIIQSIDANRLKQSLTLTADLLTTGIPMVISLNAVDETARKGMWIDSDGLSRLLGIPVVESIAVYSQGTKELKKAVGRARSGKWDVRYGDVIENGLLSIESRLPEDLAYKRAVSLLLLIDDPFIADYLKKEYGDVTCARLRKEIDEIKMQYKGNISRVIINRRNRWIDDIVDEVVKKQKVSLEGFSQSVARLSRHPVFGIPILLMVVCTMFFLVVNVANVASEWMNNRLWAPVQGAINGIFPAGFWHDLLIGDYGVLSLGLANALLTILPILLVFFLMFNTLEDIGYIPNLSVLTKRLLGKLGLSGGAIMPLVLGFGCKTMATLTTRTLRSRRERYIAVYLIAFAVPCSAQMGLNMSILGRMGASAFLLFFSVMAFVGTVAGVALNKILKEEEAKIAFIQELPAMRLPSLKAVLKKTYYRLYWFLKESLLVFVYAALALFIIDRLGILDATKRMLSPIVEGILGLPLAMVDAIILCFARHEAGAGLIINLVRKGQMDYVQCIVAVIITTLFAPCFANIMAMAKEVGGKRTVAMLFGIGVSALTVAGSLNWALVALL